MKLATLVYLALTISITLGQTPLRRLKVGKIIELKPTVVIRDARGRTVSNVKLGTLIYAGDKFEIKGAGNFAVLQPNGIVQKFSNPRAGIIQRIESKAEKDYETKVDLAAKRSAKQRGLGVIYPRNAVPASQFIVVAKTGRSSLAVTLTDLASHEELKDTLTRQSPCVFGSGKCKAWLKNRPEMEVRIEFEDSSLPECTFTLLSTGADNEIVNALAIATNADDPVGSGLKRASVFVEKGHLTLASRELAVVLQLEPGHETAVTALRELYSSGYWIEQEQSQMPTRGPTREDPKKKEFEMVFQQGANAFAKHDMGKATSLWLTGWETAEKNGWVKETANCLNNIGNIYYTLTDFRRALTYYTRAQKLREKIGNRDDAAVSLSNIGNTYDCLGQFKKALEYNLKALGLKRKIGNELDIANALCNVGNEYDALGEFQKELEFQRQALELRGKHGSEADISASINNIGNAYFGLGNYDRALQYHQLALNLRKKLNSQKDIGNSLSNTGLDYFRLGQNDRALDCQLQALDFGNKVGNRKDIASYLNNVGLVYYVLGQYDSARNYYERALTINEKIGNDWCIAGNLDNMGVVSYALGHFQQSLLLHERALKLRLHIGQLGEIAASLDNMANAYYGLGQIQTALDYHQRGLKLKSMTENGSDNAISLNNLGMVYNSVGQFQKALSYYQQALKLEEKTGNEGDIAVSLENIGAAYESLGEPGKSAVAYSRAMDLLEVITLQVRRPAEVGAIQDRLKNLYVRAATTELIRQHPETALATLERGRVQGLARQFSISGMEMYKTVISEGFNWATRSEKANDQFFLGLSKSRPDTLFVEFSTPDDNLLIFALRNGKLYTNVLHTKTKDLRDKVIKYRSALLSSESSEVKRAKDLYVLVFSPLEKAGLLDRLTKRVVIVSDGPLLELPFATLMDSNGKRLIESHSVSSAVSLNAFLWQRNPRKSTENLLVVADPSGHGGETLASTSLGGQVDPLPEARNEGREILEVFGTGKALIGKDATIGSVKREICKDSVIHFACHGAVSSRQPMHSALILAPERLDGKENGELRAEDIVSLPLSAQLVVMSACETARGVESGGEGLLGLAWAFRAAGCPAIVASQWKVDDQSSRRIMVRFYKELRGGARKDDALREAMLVEMKFRDAATTANSGPFSVAYYWAAFQLIGDGSPLSALPN